MREEKHLILVSAGYLSTLGQSAPVTGWRYPFGGNNTIQKRITKEIKAYPYWNTLPQYSQLPATYYFNAIYNTLLAFDRANMLVSLKSRRGGFLCQDLPLTDFDPTLQFNKDWNVLWDIDFSQSYYRWADASMIITALPFAIPLTFLLYPNSEDYKR